MILGRYAREILVGDATVFIAAVGTPPPKPADFVEERWELLHPAVPDVVPLDLERRDR